MSHTTDMPVTEPQATGQMPTDVQPDSSNIVVDPTAVAQNLTTQTVHDPIRKVVLGSSNLKGIENSVRVFSNVNMNGDAFELDHGVYNKMVLEELQTPIMSMTIPPMTRVAAYTGNGLEATASGQLIISNTKNSALYINALGLDVNSMQITAMEINPIYNTERLNQIQIQTQTQTQIENFSSESPIPKYTTRTMALCLIFLVLAIYVLYVMNKK